MMHTTETHRVRVINLEINVAYGCNIKCEYCSHLGRFIKGVVPLDDILHWYRCWNPKILPKNVRIIGGEPLLHPHLESILLETRSHWLDSKVELVTNGLLLPRLNDAVFSTLKTIGANVTVSKHFDDPHYNAMFAAGIDSLRGRGIEPHIINSNQFWRKCYRIVERGCAAPDQSDPGKAWRIFFLKNICTTLLDNCLYRCPLLGCYSYAVKNGFVPFDGWKVVLDYKPLEASCSSKDLEEFMNGGVCEQCSICPEKFQYADMYEKLNLFGLPVAQKLFCGDINYEQA
jgi:hypothetical protein